MKRLILLVPLSLAVSTGVLAAEKILAKVNGKVITEKDLDQAINSLPQNYRSLKNNPQFRKQLLENLVKEELLYQEALKEGVDKEPEVKRGIELLKRRVIVQALIRKHLKLKPVKVSDEEAKAFYEKNKLMFRDANGKQVPFKSVKPFIIQTLKKQKEREEFNRALNSYVSFVEKHSKVEIFVK